ncbi:MAG: hypothetical protein J2P24_00285 [Streptosporangiales bacterium]|nr:hypothetical protein [Streptosporangiales bacterium]
MTVIASRGKDIAHFQDLLTLAQVQGLDFVAAKCTESTTFVDPHYATNHSRCRSYGVPFLAYHFARPGGPSATAQAKYFLDHAALKTGDGVLLDLETSTLGQAATQAWRDQFLAYCAARYPGNERDAYLGSGYCKNGTGKGVGKVVRYLWFPHYTVTGWATKWAPGFTAAMQTNTGTVPSVWQCSDGPGFDHDVSWRTPAEFKGEADVALTQADIDKIVNGVIAKVGPAVVNAAVPTPTKYGYSSATHPMHDLLVGGDYHPTQNGKAIAAVGQAVAAVAAKLGAVVDGKVIADAVIAKLDPDAIGAAVATALQAQVADLDAAAVATAVADELGKRIEA